VTAGDGAGSAVEDSAGLIPVTRAEVVAAIDRSAAGNPLLGIGAGTHVGLPAAGLASPSGSGGDAARQLVDAVGAWLDAAGAWPGAAEPRVVASLVVLGYAARLVGPTIAVLLRDGILLDAGPNRVRYSYAAGTGFRLTLPEPAGWQGPVDAVRAEWCRQIVDGHLSALVTAVREVTPVAAGLLWGNVAAGAAGALGALAATGAVSAGRCYDEGRRLLDHGPLRDAGHLSLHDDRLRYRRRSCCLYYRLAGGGTCADCCLRPPTSGSASGSHSASGSASHSASAGES
jgi:ferric iron reductase protein FhuF